MEAANRGLHLYIVPALSCSPGIEGRTIMSKAASLGDTMTPAQLRVARCIERFSREHKRPPTRMEIAHILGFSSANAAQCHVQVLTRKGYLFTDKMKSRGLSLTKLYFDEIRQIERARK